MRDESTLIRDDADIYSRRQEERMKGAGLASDGSALMRAACKNAVCSHSSAPVATVRLYRSIGSGESVAARFVSSMLIAGPGAQSREGSDQERLGFCPFQLPENHRNGFSGGTRFIVGVNGLFGLPRPKPNLSAKAREPHEAFEGGGRSSEPTPIQGARFG
jgi:hypothetical protein